MKTSDARNSSTIPPWDKRDRRRATRSLIGSALMALPALLVVPHSYAEEGNSDFWLSGVGLQGSSAAAGYYPSSADARVNKDAIMGGVFDAGVNQFLGPTYRLETPALVSVNLLGLAGYFNGQIGATLTGPLGQTISGSRSIG